MPRRGGLKSHLLMPSLLACMCLQKRKEKKNTHNAYTDPNNLHSFNTFTLLEIFGHNVSSHHLSELKVSRTQMVKCFHICVQLFCHI